MGEILRHFFPQLMPRLREYRLTELDVALEAVLDCRDATALGLAAEDLVKDYDFTIPQAVAAAAVRRDVEGLLVRSATGLGDNLVIFPAKLRSTSQLRVVGSRDPRLYVARDG